MSNNQFLLDVHKRVAVYESHYVPKQHSTLDFMIAHSKDCEIISKFLDFNLNQNKESKQFCKENIKESLKNGYVILATDCFDLCGLIFGTLNGQLLDKSEFVPKNVYNYLMVNLISVREKYQNAKIEQRLWTEMLKLAKSKDLSRVIYLPLNGNTNEIDVKSNGLSTKTIESHKLKNPSIFDEKSISLVIANLSKLDDYLKDGEPHLPDDYTLPDAKRILIKKVFAKRLNSEISYEFAVKEDEQVIRLFLLNEYFRQTMLTSYKINKRNKVLTQPNTRTLQCRKQDGDAMLKRFKSEVIDQGLTILAIYQGKLCGLMINGHGEINENQSNSPPPEFPSDFTKQIDEQPFTHIGSKAVLAVGTWMKSFTKHYVSGDNKYLFLDMLSVHPHIRGCKIGLILWEESLKLAQNLGYCYVQTICTAIASNKIASASKMKPVLSVEYGKIRYNGIQLFESGEVFDGGREMTMYIGDLNEIFS